MVAISLSPATEVIINLRRVVNSPAGDRDIATITKFIDNYLLASDSRALRDHYKNSMPDVDMSYEGEDGRFRTIPIGLDFFWPDIADRF